MATKAAAASDLDPGLENPERKVALGGEVGGGHELDLERRETGLLILVGVAVSASGAIKDDVLPGRQDRSATSRAIEWNQLQARCPRLRDHLMAHRRSSPPRPVRKSRAAFSSRDGREASSTPVPSITTPP